MGLGSQVACRTSGNATNIGERKIMDPRWLKWAKKLQGIAQTGLTYAEDPFDVERYESIRLMAAEMMAAGSGEKSVDFFVKLLSKEVGYATPKVDVRAAVFRGGNLLLVREKEDGLWTLPGGWADIGDSPSAAVVREVKEESGYDIRARKLLALLDRNLHGHPPIPYHAYKLFFLGDLVGGNAQAKQETDAVDFFPKDAIPPLSLTRVTPVQIARLFEHFLHPEWPTQFD
jgi:ADP-ribose pyrophosphatase YjhB (NUDIX family)